MHRRGLCAASKVDTRQKSTRASRCIRFLVTQRVLVSLTSVQVRAQYLPPTTSDILITLTASKHAIPVGSMRWRSRDHFYRLDSRRCSGGVERRKRKVRKNRKVNTHVYAYTRISLQSLSFPLAVIHAGQLATYSVESIPVFSLVRFY